MTISFDIRSAVPAATFADVLSWLHHVDATFSTYRIDSEISRFGRGEIDIDSLTTETEGVLLRCVELTEISDGAFDAFAVPAPNGTHLDPSGFVKGWSIERAAVMLETAGVEHLCINAGGDVALRGRPEPGRAWSVGIRHPSVLNAEALVLELSGPAAIATSAPTNAVHTSSIHARANRPLRSPLRRSWVRTSASPTPSPRRSS